MKKLYGVLGNPIKHSLSPLIHNDAFVHNGIDGTYLPFLIEAPYLKQAVEGMKALGAGGFNVTVPFKTDIIPYLDQLDDFAKSVGAVNTVVVKNQKLYGYNTDGPGFVKGLLDFMEGSLHDKHVLIIGAGGAARGIYFAMAGYPLARLDMANRTETSALKLIKDGSFDIQSTALSLDKAEENLANYDIVIQTTSVGLANPNESPLSLENIKRDTVVCDIIYNPLKTKFLKEAEQKGCLIQTGVDMFVNQAVLAFELWTEKSPDAERMKQLVLRNLGG